ncbi:MAG: hypothetical protein WDO56_09125 [Gammaproteobacteria bacterium]
MPASSSKSGSSVTATLPAGSLTALDQVPNERRGFRALLAGNPNYFGNLNASAFAPAIAVNGNTTYESLHCVGFHPQLQRLDAVVFINQSFGYNGGVCSAGSTEYVRFYLSFDHGRSWVDQGVSSFTVHDVPLGTTGKRHLEYATSIRSRPPKKWCSVPNVILARATLSWNHIPPPHTPDYNPVWGNRHDTHIQVDPVWFIKWLELFELNDIKLKPSLAQSLDLDSTVALAPKKALSLVELKELYKSQGVEPHRFAMTELKQLIHVPESTAYFQTDVASALGTTSLAAIIAALLGTDGSTVYEELDCVGLNPDGFANTLVAVLRIKRSSGFSGGPCTHGSREYVTFWGDFNNNGTYETCLGTASVQVFDLPTTDGGIEYSVSLPVNLNPYRRPCGEGPRVVPIRAILSWNEAPPCGNPNWVPTWGNREETVILIPPGKPHVAGDFTPYFYDVSGVNVCNIAQSTGLAAGDRPFGGELCITGEIPAALDLSSAGLLEYRLWATQGTVKVPIVTPFLVSVEQGFGSGPVSSHNVTQTTTADYFPYLEYGTPAIGAWGRVSSPNRLLARWYTGSLTGLWTIHMEARVVGTTTTFLAGTTLCLLDGTTRTDIKVALDQESPVCHVGIVGYTDAAGFHAAQKCDDFTVGVTINGTFDVTDNMGVGSYGLSLEPPVAGATVVTVENPASNAQHRFGTWSIKADLPPCGYVVRLDASDRTIADCTSVWSCVDEAGFCLRKPG